MRWSFFAILKVFLKITKTLVLFDRLLYDGTTRSNGWKSNGGNFMKKGTFSRCLLMGLFCLFLLMPGITGQAAGTGTVKNRILNVRTEATTASTIVCKLTQGMKVSIDSEKTGTDGMKWYQVSFTYNGTTKKGYVRSDLLTASGSWTGSSTAITSSNSTASSAVDRLVNAEKLRVTGNAVRVRDSASLNGAVIASLDQGTQVSPKKAKTGTDGRQWIKVSFTYRGSKVQGYIRSDFLAVAVASNTASTGTVSNSSNTSVSYKEGDVLKVTATAVRVRKQPSTSETVIANLLQGDTGTYVKEKKGSDGKTWIKISFQINGTKYKGYVRSDYLTKSSSAGESTASTDGEEYRYVTATAVRVREKASSSSTIVANLLQGDKVKFKKEKKGDDGKNWTKVSFTINGQRIQGYIRSDYLK